MSAPDPVKTSGPALLLLVDPVARAFDGESVRIARDVLCAGAPETKVCLPDGPLEAERMLARRGSRRTVVIGDDRALVRTVRLLHRERELGGTVLSAVPVGAFGETALLRNLGVPGDTVLAARAAAGGVETRRDVLVDDSGGLVLGGLHIPAPGRGAPPVPGASPWRRACRAVAQAVRVPAQGGRGGARHRLRVEADGELFADLGSGVEEVSVTTESAGTRGLAEVTIRSDSLPGSVVTAGAGPRGDPASAFVRVRARTVTVSGRDFRYRADAADCGPVRSRTWRVEPGVLRLALPAVPPQGRPPGGAG